MSFLDPRRAFTNSLSGFNGSAERILTSRFIRLYTYSFGQSVIFLWHNLVFTVDFWWFVIERISSDSFHVWPEFWRLDVDIFLVEWWQNGTDWVAHSGISSIHHEKLNAWYSLWSVSNRASTRFLCG
jgi:hypothetical protein